MDLDLAQMAADLERVTDNIDEAVLAEAEFMLAAARHIEWCLCTDNPVKALRAMAADLRRSANRLAGMEDENGN